MDVVMTIWLRHSSRLRLGSVALACLALLMLFGCHRAAPSVSIPEPAPEEPAKAPAVKEATTEQVHQFCGACHLYPPPDTFPRSDWRREVARGYRLFEETAEVPASITRVPPM